MRTVMELRYDKLGPKVAKALESRFFEAWYFSETPEAVEKVFSLIPKTDTVSWGGSLTTTGLNLTAMAAEKGYKVIDRDKAASPEERWELMRQALLCGTYLTGTNALTEDGQLVNVDGNGNRVAAMTFGPRQVIVVAGMNKVAPTLEDALRRARQTAGPVNAQRVGLTRTPCAQTGRCADCQTGECICSHIVITRMNRVPGRVKLVLAGEELGF